MELKNVTALKYFIVSLFLQCGLTLITIVLINNHCGLAVWLPTGLAFTILALFGVRFWPAVFSGVFLAAIITKTPLFGALGITLGTTIGPLVAALLFFRSGFHFEFENFHGLKTLLISAAISSTIGSSLTATGLIIAGIIPLEVLINRWLIFWLSDIIGIIAILPLTYVWQVPIRFNIKKTNWKLIEVTSLFVLSAGLTLFFIKKEIYEINDFYIFFPVLIWAGLRFGKRATTTLVFFIVILINLLYAFQMSLNKPVYSDTLMLEISLLSVILTALVIAMIIFQRRQVENRIKEINDHLEQRVKERTEALTKEISERVRMEETIRESEEKLRNIIDNSVDGIILVNTEGQILEWNKGLENITSLKRTEVFGKNISDIMDMLTLEEDKNEQTSKYNQTYNKNNINKSNMSSSSMVRKKIQCHNEIIKTIEMVNFSVESQKQTLLGTIIRDITEQQKFADAIYDYAYRLRVLQGIDHAIIEAQSLDGLINVILVNIRHLVKCPWISIITYDKNEVSYFSIDHHPQINPELAACFDVGKLQIPPKLKQGKLEYIPVLENYPDLTLELTSLLNGGIQSVIRVPLLVGNELIGVINLGATETNAFESTQIEIAQDVSNELAIAINHARLLEQVRAGREELRQLAQKMVSVQEDERRRISRELHDEAGQSLTALKISLELILKDLPPKHTQIYDNLKDAISLTGSTMEQIRLLARGLRPPALEAVGLNYTLEDYCREYAKRTGIIVDYHGASLPALPDEIGICFYRILQESLTNIYKHAKAHSIKVNLQRKAESIVLTIKDDGQGIQQTKKINPTITGIGLLGMKERLKVLGGNLEIESIPGQGTMLLARIPWEGSDD